MTGSGPRYIEILDPNRPNPESRSESAINPDLLALGNQKLELRLREINSDLTTSRPTTPNRLEPNSWLDRSGFARHLSKFEKSTIREWIQIPESDSNNNTIISIIIQATLGLIFRAQKNAQSDVVGLASLEYVNRKESGENTNEKPLNSRLQPNTIRKYAGFWSKILVYLYNTWYLNDSDRPSYRKSNKQLKTWQKLISTIEIWLRYVKFIFFFIFIFYLYKKYYYLFY